MTRRIEDQRGEKEIVSAKERKLEHGFPGVRTAASRANLTTPRGDPGSSAPQLPETKPSSNLPSSETNYEQERSDELDSDDEIQIIEKCDESDSDVQIVEPLPNPTSSIVNWRKTCDLHARVRTNCSKSDPMCKAHCFCRHRKRPVFDPESLFITCQWCTDCFLAKEFSSDPDQHRIMKKLADDSREVKGSRIESLRVVQEMLIANASLFAKLRENEKKHKKLTDEIVVLHEKRRKSSAVALSFEEWANELQDEKDASESENCFMKVLVKTCWDTLVYDCFLGIVTYFNFSEKQKYRTSSISNHDYKVVFKWLQTEDRQAARENVKSPMFLTFNSSWCEYLDNLPRNELLWWIYQEWLNPPVWSTSEKEVERRWGLVRGKSKDVIEFLKFVRNVIAHYADSNYVFDQLITKTRKDPAFSQSISRNDAPGGSNVEFELSPTPDADRKSDHDDDGIDVNVLGIGRHYPPDEPNLHAKRIERELMFIFDELSGYGLRGWLKKISRESTPEEVRYALKKWVNFKTIDMLLGNFVIKWGSNEKVEDVMVRIGVLEKR